MNQLTPVQIDTELARLWQIEQTAAARQARLLRPRTDRSVSEANKTAAAEQETIRAQARADAAPYEAEYAARGGWSRYFLVQNAGGNAPAHPRFAGPSRRDLAAREAKAAEKTARDAKKAEKNLTVDETFRGYMSWVTTVAGAKQAIRDAIEMANYGEVGHRHPWADAAETAAAAATAVLLARGVPQAEIDRIVANTTKRVAKENAR